jgi:hypothetical protein
MFSLLPIILVKKLQACLPLWYGRYQFLPFCGSNESEEINRGLTSTCPLFVLSFETKYFQFMRSEYIKLIFLRGIYVTH